MYPPVFAVAFQSADLKAKLGSSPMRFYMFGLAPETKVYPYAVWQVVAGSPDNVINGLPCSDVFTVQVDLYDKSSNGVRDCAKAMRNALEPYAHIVSWRGESRDDETMSFRSSFDLDWFVQRQ